MFCFKKTKKQKPKQPYQSGSTLFCETHTYIISWTAPSTFRVVCDGKQTPWPVCGYSRVGIGCRAMLFVAEVILACKGVGKAGKFISTVCLVKYWLVVRGAGTWAGWRLPRHFVSTVSHSLGAFCNKKKKSYCKVAPGGDGWGRSFNASLRFSSQGPVFTMSFL